MGAICVCYGCSSACVAQEDRARAEALLYFKGKHSNDLSANGSVDDGNVLDPLLQDLTASIDSQLQALQKQSSQLSDCLKVWALCSGIAQVTLCAHILSLQKVSCHQR